MEPIEIYSVWHTTGVYPENPGIPLDEFLESLDPMIRSRFSREFLEDQRERLERSGAEVLTIYDESYPKLLREVPKPPAALFCLGDASVLGGKMVSVVGTRRSDVYGERLAFKFSGELAEYFTVVSGMAFGIDSKAHEGALETGTTVAVLASGVDVPTPRSKKRLYERIIDGGCVLSPYPLGEGAKKYRFVERNSVIAGLSVGTLVVQAPRKSGALITAGYAVEFGRDVFAIPGDVWRRSSEGTNWLIKVGAIPVTSPRDILEYYSIEPPEKVDVRSEILDLIRNGVTTVDELLERTGMDVGELMAEITELELSGILVNDGGVLRLI